MTVLEVLKFHVEEGSSHDVVQRNDELFFDGFDGDFGVHNLCSCRLGALSVAF